MILLRTLGYLSYLLPLPIALLSPLADRPEWAFWMILPFFASLSVLRWTALLRVFYRPVRRWSPYLTGLATTSLVWALAGLVAAVVHADGWGSVLLTVAVMLLVLRGIAEIAVALVIVSSYLVTDPLIFAVVATPGAVASVAWLAGSSALHAVDERVRAAVMAGRRRLGRAVAFALMPVVPLAGPEERVQIAELVAAVMWFTESRTWAVRWQRWAVRIRRRRRDTHALLVALRNLAMFEHTAWWHDAARRTLAAARTVLTTTYRDYLAGSGMSPAVIAVEARAWLAEFAVEEVEMSAESGDISAAAEQIDDTLQLHYPSGTDWPDGMALAELRQRLQKSYHQLMLIKADIAGAYLHDEAEAERIYQNMVEEAKSFEGERFVAERVSQAVVRLSSVLVRKGRYAEAERMLRDVLADSPHVRLLGLAEVTRANLANLARIQGDYERAEPLYRELLSEFGRRRDRGLAITVHAGLSDVLAARGKLFEARELATAAVQEADEAGTEMARRSSLLVLGRICEQAGDDEAAIEAYRRAMMIVESTRNRITADDTRVDYVGGERRLESYDRLVSIHLRLGRIGEAYDYVERAKARVLLDRMAAGDSSLGGWAEPLDHQQVRTALAESNRPVLLVEYTVREGELVVFGVRGDAEIEVETVRVDPVELRRFTQANFGIASRVREMTRSGLDELWHGLDDLVAPVTAWSRPGDLVVFVPHGILSYLPLHALRVDGDYLIARNPVSYAPSASVLVRSRQTRARADGTTAVFGDPTGDLVHARSEAVAVAELLGTQAILGSDVTTDAFVSHVAGATVVHFAGHAFFDTAEAADSALRLTNGLLSAREIQELSGLRARVVTLSGCETGVSRNHPGDELIGLTRAFLYAGAATVVAGLWRVADDSTTELMNRFYRGLVSGEPAVEALRHAMLATAARPGWSALYHWAPFILVGDWE